MVTHNPGYREKRIVKTIDCFKGLSPNVCAGDGYFTEAKLFCSDNYPGVKTSKNKRSYRITHLLNGEITLGGTDKLFYTCDDGFVYDNTLYTGITPGKKILASLGNTVAIFPDKYCFSKLTEYYYYTETSGLKKITPLSTVNDCVSLLSVSSSAPASAKEGDKYYNDNTGLIYTYENGVWANGVTPDATTVYSTSYDSFEKMSTRLNWYFQTNGTAKIETLGYDGDMNKNDLLKLSLFRNDEYSNASFDRFSIGTEVKIFGLKPNNVKYEKQLEALSAGTEIVGYGYGYVIFKNNVGIDNINTYLSNETKTVVIESIIPSLDCAVCVGDRIWGAKDNIIYACAPGNIHSWGSGNDYDTHVTLKSEASGKIIGCADLGGVPVFFNENSVTKVTRVYNGYRLNTVPAPSLSKTNPDSIACVGGNLYYMSDCGVICYNGTTFKKIESGFEKVLTDCKGGTDGNKYYLASSDLTYIYDPINKVWYTDTAIYRGFARFGPYFAAIPPSYINHLFYIIGNCEGLDFPMLSGQKRCLVLAPFDEGTHATKYYSKLIFKISCFANPRIKIEVSYDGKPFQTEGEILSGNGPADIHIIELKPTPCKSMQLRITSTDSQTYTIISITREYSIHENKK